MHLFFAADSSRLPSIQSDLEAVVKTNLGGDGRLEIDAAVTPVVARRPTASCVGRAVALSIIGHARPGYVHHALSEVRNLNVLGATMRILGAYTGMVLVVDLPHEEAADSLASRVERSLVDWDRRSGEIIMSTVHCMELHQSLGSWDTEPSHKVEVRAPNHPGVVRDLTEMMASYRANIVSLEGGSEDSGEGFVVRLWVAVPSAYEAEVREALFELAARNKWAALQFDPIEEPDGV